MSPAACMSPEQLELLRDLLDLCQNMERVEREDATFKYALRPCSYHEDDAKALAQAAWNRSQRWKVRADGLRDLILIPASE